MSHCHRPVTLLSCPTHLALPCSPSATASRAEEPVLDASAEGGDHWGSSDRGVVDPLEPVGEAASWADGLAEPRLRQIEVDLLRDVLQSEEGVDAPVVGPSGRRPANHMWAGERYDNPKRWTPKLQRKYPDGVWFTDDGFPDFSPYAMEVVRFEPRFDGNHDSDFQRANRAAGLTEKPESHTWHHHQDGRTMLLIPKAIHNAIRHAGGVAIINNR